MSMISYAQNYEDVVLTRALRSVCTGFYIDVGALSPEFHSVTKAFYDRGWSGINIEPNPDCHAELVAERPRDVNLAEGVSDEPGELLLYVFTDTGLSTFDESIAKRHEESGWAGRECKVATSTLRDIWLRHIPDGQDVHFLKVDVEGFERQVIVSNDWKERRPWIVIVEATAPLTPLPNHESWEPFLLQAGYQHAYFDGLNRFYVADEHADLIPELAIPPNVFDEFRPIAQVRAEQRLTESLADLDEWRRRFSESENRWQEDLRKLHDTEREVEQLRGRLEAAEAELERLTFDLQALLQTTESQKTLLESTTAQLRLVQAELNNMLASRSWRVTYPLRRLSQGVHVLGPPVESITRRSLAAVWARAAASPRLKARILRLARADARVGGILNHLQEKLHGPAAYADPTLGLFARDPSDLSAEARAALDVLQNVKISAREVR